MSETSVAVNAHDDDVYFVFPGIFNNLLIDRAFAYCRNYIYAGALEFGCLCFKVLLSPT